MQALLTEMGIKDNKTLNAKIGGYKLPADFKCLNLKFLTELYDLSFEERITSIYNFVLGKNLSNEAFSSINESDFPASVLSVDDGISVLELFDGKSCNYSDYFLGADTLEDKVISLAFTIVSAYVDLASGGVIELGEKINVASGVPCGKILLALDFCKKIKLPIDTVILGVDKPCDEVVKGVFFASPIGSEIEEITSAFFEDTEYLLDPGSASGLVAYDLFYADYEDGCETLLLSLNSPFLFARSLLKTVTQINELSVDKAIDKLSEFTALECPLQIISGKLPPFYRSECEICVKDALEIIKH